MDHPYDYFQESIYEHSSTVTALEKNFKEPTVFATGGKDGRAMIWQLAGIQGHDDVELVTEISAGALHRLNGSSLNLGTITSVKWYDENTVALSLTNGTLQLNDIRLK